VSSESSDQVAAVLKLALEAVRKADIPEALEEVGFGRAIDLLGAGVAIPKGQSATLGSSLGGGDHGDRVTKIARRMGIDPGALAYVYDVDDDGVTLVVQRSKLAKDKANASREVALLYAAARQAGGFDEGSTPSGEIRQRVSDMGVLDANNFGPKLAAMRDWFAIKGAGQKREFKVTQHGYEEAAKIVHRITGATEA
jgi:hypothetical protein